MVHHLKYSAHLKFNCPQELEADRKNGFSFLESR